MCIQRTQTADTDACNVAGVSCNVARVSYNVARVSCNITGNTCNITRVRVRRIHKAQDNLQQDRIKNVRICSAKTGGGPIHSESIGTKDRPTIASLPQKNCRNSNNKLT